MVRGRSAIKTWSVAGSKSTADEAPDEGEDDSEEEETGYGRLDDPRPVGVSMPELAQASERMLAFGDGGRTVRSLRLSDLRCASEPGRGDSVIAIALELDRLD